MRLERLDHLPGGRSLELHRRLTVLLGAPPEVVAHLVAVVRSAAAGGPVDHDGRLELHGSRMDLHGWTFDVEGTTTVDPVLDLAGPPPLRPVRPQDRSSVGPFRRARGPQVEMREVDPPLGRGEGSEHDPAARTRRIAADDLVRLRGELRSLEGEQMQIRRRAEEVRADLDSFARATLDVAAGQLEALEARRSAASSGLQEPVGSRDPVGPPTDRGAASVDAPGSAPELADRADELCRSTEEQRTRRSVLRELLDATGARLADARQELEDLTGPGTSMLDVATVDRLESTRDRILELERGSEHLVASERRALLVELRSVEAELLDRLGFETYADFVMGGSDPAAEQVSHAVRDAATAEVRLLEAELELLRHEMSLLDGDDLAAARAALVQEAAVLLATSVEGVSRLTDRELAELLRTPASDRRRPPARSAPTAPPDDGGRMADLEAEVQALRARVADGEVRVERHERATEELAALRAGELELRERERDLHVRIGDRERLLSLLGSGIEAPSDEVFDAGTDQEPRSTVTSTDASAAVADAEVLRRSIERDASVAWPVDHEWLLLARLGELRSVGRIGPVPLVVSGIDAAAPEAPALLHRVASMSDLVQIVVLAADDDLVTWAASLGGDAALVRW